jgi:glycosyltransferase involved in cell wall biosynthesis
MKVLLQAPILTQSGYGEHARLVFKSLKLIPSLEIYTIAVPWGNTAWVSEYDDAIKNSIMETHRYFSWAKANNVEPAFDVQIFVGIPNEFEKRAPYSVCVTAGIESDRVSYNWLLKTHEGIDKIVVPSTHAKKGFIATSYEVTNKEKNQRTVLSCKCPVDVVPYPVKKIVPSNMDLDLETDFNFLAVALFGPRKNLESTVEWFVKEFRNDENVGLVLKTAFVTGSKIDKIRTEENLKQFLNKLGDRKCKVYLLHGSLTEEQIHGIYNNPKIKAIVSTTHGEGFGLPLFEASYNGLPVIATGWSAHLDFLKADIKQKKTGKLKEKSLFAKVEYELRDIPKEAVWENILVEGSRWAYPSELSFRKQMKNVRHNYGMYKKWAEALKEKLLTSHEEQKILNEMLVSVLGEERIEALSPKKIDISTIPKISIITSVYNGDKFIRPFLEDITQQSIFKEKCELILINAASPGNEDSTISEYQEKYPDNIIYEKLDTDPGIYGVWNHAIKRSSGEFITNANLDDRHSIDFMERLGSFLADNKDSDLVYSENLLTFKENETYLNNSSEGQVYPAEEFSIEAMLRGNAPHCMPMWRKSLHDTNGFFNQKYKSAGDWDFWLTCALNGSKFKKYKKPLGLYYFNPKGVSTDTDNAVWKSKEEREVFKKHQSAYTKT